MTAIEEARDGEAAALAALLNRVPWGDGLYTAERLAAAARDDPVAMHVVARTDGRVVGGAIAYGGGRWAQPDRAFMVPALFVDEGHRRNRIGSAIAERIESRAFAGGAARVVTTVRADAEGALAFATGRGYREFHREAIAVLDLDRWDESRVAPTADAKTHLTTIRDVLDADDRQPTVAAIQRAHDEILADLPPSEIAFPRRDASAYERELLRTIDRDASVVAWHDKRIAALILVTRLGDGASLVVAGEVGPGRGRKLIVDAKVHAIRALRAAGVHRLRSIFDRDNAMPRQLNRSLGFEMQPPMVRMELRR